MTTNAFIGGLSVYIVSTDSPQELFEIEEVTSLSGFGKTNPLVDATSHDSTAREYIAGLSEGQELSIECNRIHSLSGSPLNNVQDDLVGYVNSKLTKNFRIVLSDNNSPIRTKTYNFAGVCLSWVVTPSFDDKNMISFTVKISGDITIS